MTLDIFQQWSGQNAWVIQVFFVVLLFLLFAFLQRLILRRLEKKLEQTPNPWDDAFVNVGFRGVRPSQGPPLQAENTRKGRIGRCKQDAICYPYAMHRTLQ